MQVHDEAMFGAGAGARRHRPGRGLYRRPLGFSPTHRPADAAGQQPRRAEKAVYGSWRSLLAARVRHWLNRNSRAGSKRNIMAHYDLGNDFYQLWLDPTHELFRRRSTAPSTTATLETAQRAKYRRILRPPACRAGRSACWKSAAAGAALPNWRSRDGPAGHRPDPVAGAARRGRRQRVPAGRSAPAGLPRHPTSSSTTSCRSRCSRRSASAGGRPTSRPSPAALKPGRPGGGPEHHHPRRPVRALPHAAPTSSSNTSSPAACCPRARPSARPGRASRAGGARRTMPSAATTPARWPNGAAPSKRRWPEIAALGFDERFHRLWRFYLAYCEAGFPAAMHRCHAVRAAPPLAVTAPARCGTCRRVGRAGARPAATAGRQSSDGPTAGLAALGQRRIPPLRLRGVRGHAVGGGDDPLRPPLALQLTYRRNIAGAAIAEASVKEIRKLGCRRRAAAALGRADGRVFPDVGRATTSSACTCPGRRAFLLQRTAHRRDRRPGVRPRLLRHLARRQNQRAGSARGLAASADGRLSAQR